jgi:nucleotide-binding universal stress UspA family protein
MKTILIATDGSATARAAVELGLRLAEASVARFAEIPH